MLFPPLLHDAFIRMLIFCFPIGPLFGDLFFERGFRLFKVLLLYFHNFLAQRLVSWPAFLHVVNANGVHSEALHNFQDQRDVVFVGVRYQNLTDRIGLDEIGQLLHRCVNQCVVTRT